MSSHETNTREFNSLVIIPRLKRMSELYGIRASKAALAMMDAIGLQESRFQYRDQINTGIQVIGPATGPWQFEKGGGVRGVMRHDATKGPAAKCVEEFYLPFDEHTIWRSFVDPNYDGLSCSFARLLLYSDPRSLPAPTFDNEEVAWQYYIRNWRPGKPHRQTWGEFWGISIKLARESELD